MLVGEMYILTTEYVPDRIVNLMDMVSMSGLTIKACEERVVLMKGVDLWMIIARPPPDLEEGLS